MVERSLAYSYLRFSSPQQAKGDSLHRQIKARQSWLDAHPGVELDKSLVMTDAGRSAFNRKDWDTYALARFVECIKSGRVEPLSYLLVENLDRLSRENAGEATELFLSIVNKGVVVVQLSPVVTEFARPVNMHSLMFAIMELSRGHSESAIKSERCRAAWSRKNAEAGTRVVTRKLPGWVRCDDDGVALTLDPVAAATVRRAFDLARNGHSTIAIAKLFNAEAVPVLGRRVVKGRPVAWGAPTVYQILTSRAAIGEYVPYRWTRRADKPAGEPVQRYYPPVVDEDTFHAVRAALAVRGSVGRGRRGKHVNLLAGLLKDAKSGGSLSYCHRVGLCDLVPVQAKHGAAGDWVSFPAAPFERALLSKLSEVRVADVEDGPSNVGRKVESLAGKYAEAEQKVKWYQAKCDETEQEGYFNIFAAKSLEWERKRMTLAAELSKAQREAASPLAEAWGEYQSLADLLAEDSSDDLRVRVRAALRRSVDGIYCLFVRRDAVRLAAVRVQFRGASHRDFLMSYQRGWSNQNVKRPGTTTVLSFSGTGIATGIDLRERKDVRAVERALSRMDVSALAARGDAGARKPDPEPAAKVREKR